MPKPKTKIPIPKGKGPLTLTEQIQYLFEWGHSRGLAVTYGAVADALGESRNNIYRLHKGLNVNPSLSTLKVIASYFETDIGYFSCSTLAACRAYLEGAPLSAADQPAGIALRADGISADGLKKIRDIIDLVRAGEQATRQDGKKK